MRVSLITGISQGLGAALCDQLSEAGDRVVGIGRRFQPAQHARAGESLVLRKADLSRPETLPEVAELTGWLAPAGSALLIHNAGVVEPIGAVGELAPAALASTVTINLTAPILLTNAFLAALPPSTPATILFVSSGAAHRVVDGWATYSATKRGGEFFFESLAAQLAAADRPVTVASVNPGVMDTGMQATIRQAAAGPGWFPGGDRFVGLDARGELPSPAEVAARIIAEHVHTGQ